MQDLKRLVKVIADNTPKVMPLIDHSDYTGLESKLYQFIKNNEALTDEEACTYLYGEQKISPSYRMLKSRLRKKLLNNLFFAELSENHFRKCRIVHAECSSLLLQAQKLAYLGEPYMAEKLADQVIVIAQKAELNDILTKAYEIKQDTDLISNNRGKFDQNFALLQRYFSLETQEREALLIYNKLKFEVNFNLSNYRKQTEAYCESLALLKSLWEASGSSKVFDFYHMMRTAYCELTGDYEGVITVIKEAQQLLADGLINEHWFNERFNNYILVYTYLRLGQLADGLYYANLYLKNFREGSNNWFAFLENYVILALYSKDYTLAVKLCALAISKGALEYPRASMREMWGMLEKYVYLISNKAPINNNVSFSLKELETSIISKDKEGYNLPLLILEYLENLPKLDAEDMDMYSARFSKYTSKYLKGEAGSRARLFIRLLLLSMKGEGDKLEEKGATLLEKLKNTPTPRDPIGEVEIVPYEHLWELVLEIHPHRVKN
ncbi:hypothetical protein ABID22_002376 [Pontibacter aydingkolensis]|uniref:Uncharacterized protein n=1 Tax=Pontibacter aydingkolensis TaxID=1911536 RepID=A0ABS7CVZ9_9BACT|nr:hypothetical protein [Pontibacter aydingkolensis]MBW7467977.1 hypothetical protein [Pontibacter aydingkolensis]